MRLLAALSLNHKKKMGKIAQAKWRVNKIKRVTQMGNNLNQMKRKNKDHSLKFRGQIKKERGQVMERRGIEVLEGHLKII